MFYNKKRMYFLILFLMSCGIYFIIRDQSLFGGVMANAIFGAVILYAFLLLACFLITVAIALLLKFAYIAGCEILKKEQKANLPKIFWIIFTALGYLAVFAAYIKIIWY
ncbi:hypothetical protein [Endomicrobium proavitum]|uniref:Uncharacterized protein n=1 Tax=Endomicrobium proavitum TaxID=1408281 RepID=A0A0G3WLL5_9BACT|nr:hypothetical protein [Endomicrobium proavitum]AKL98394.1 membrane protein of unknown function [Endomicrobium proavitum]